MLKPLVDELIKLVKAGTNLAKEELPVIAKQILKYNLWACIVWIIAGLASLTVTAFFILLALHLPDSGCEGTIVLCGFGAVGTGLFGLIAVIANVLDILKITLAPRLYLLEYLKSFLEPSSND